MIHFTSHHTVNSTVACGDKSISHRALILAAISGGKCTLRNLSLCDDVMSTVDCLRTLGATVRLQGTTATVEPIVRPNRHVTLNCGNSGTTARLLAGVVAGLGVHCTFVGDSSLMRRPMQRILQPLSALGAHFTQPPDALFCNVPAKLTGKQLVAQTKSAQVKSGILLAALFAEGKTCYTETFPTRNHTEILLQQIGAEIKCEENTITVGKSQLSPFQMDIPNDISSLAFPMALALLEGTSHTFCNVVANSRRTGFVQVLQNAGANIVMHNRRIVFGEDICDISVGKGQIGQLKANAQQVCDAIDELPLLAAIAIATKGKHRFCGVSELQFKESNRLLGIVQMAQACNQQAYLEGEDLVVESNGNPARHPFFATQQDHRLAMSQAVLALSVCNGGTLDGENFAISFPQFLQSVGVEPLRFALVGSNIQRSFSPLLMMTLAQNANVCCSYALHQLTEDVPDQILLQTLLQYDGVNVTMPFKGRAAQLLGAAVPSVNTVGKHIAPQSTDGTGLVQALQERGKDLQNAPLWIVGAGMAAEACIAQLQRYNCKIQVFNRTPQRAERLQKYNLQTVSNPVGVLSFVPDCPFERQLPFPSSVKFWFSADYHNAHMPQICRQRQVEHISGLEMLYFQGAQSFALWTGTPPQTDCAQFLKMCTR